MAEHQDDVMKRRIGPRDASLVRFACLGLTGPDATIA
jgi:hypothetical protein